MILLLVFCVVDLCGLLVAELGSPDPAGLFFAATIYPWSSSDFRGIPDVTADSNLAVNFCRLGLIFRFAGPPCLMRNSRLSCGIVYRLFLTTLYNLIYPT